MGSRTIPILESERLRLRGLRPSDLDDYAALHADPEVMRYVGPVAEIWDRGRSWRHLAFAFGHWKLGGAGSWAVEHRETREFLGVIGFWEPEGWPGCELAWKIARPFWGRGYATEGARLALAYAFQHLRRERIISLIHPENRASIRVAEKIGETLQGTSDHLGREMLVYGVEREVGKVAAGAVR